MSDLNDLFYKLLQYVVEENGCRLDIVIKAEDVDAADTYREVQGQIDANGNFALITTTSTTSADEFLLLETGDFLLQEDGTSKFILEA